jgi:hypothetical protein
MRLANPFCQFLDYEIFFADEELVFDVYKVFGRRNDMEISLVYALLLLHQTLAPCGCTSQELMSISA